MARNVKSRWATVCRAMAAGCLFALIGLCAPVWGEEKSAFSIYGLIVYRDLSTPATTALYVTPAVAQRYGIQPINLVYEPRLLDVDKAVPHNTKFDAEKIDAVAKGALDAPHELVALDMENWDRFDTARTPELYLRVLEEFRKVNSHSKVGLYGVVPQVTYGWRKDMPSKYDPLNASYKMVAAAVDYFSPSLYNWERALADGDWERAAEYAIHAARAFDVSKPVIPYVTPEVTRKGKTPQTTFLTYEQMLFRLRTLKRLGADGCIVWTGTANGRKAGGTFDPKSGWAKAIVDFQKEGY